MKLEEAENKFIEIWGALGTQWGINRTMAQIHAYLMVKNDPKTTEDIMRDLQISRGSANMNTRALIEWGLVHKVIKSGERKDFFIAERDIWEVTKKIASQRRKKELIPLLSKLEQLEKSKIEDSGSQKHFNVLVKEISEIANITDDLLFKLEKVERTWLSEKLLKLMVKN